MNGARRIVICGGGAIGAAIAYFLSRRGARPIVIERHVVAGAASGKSGGFLALDWCRGTPLDRRRSDMVTLEITDPLGTQQFRGLGAFDAFGHRAQAEPSGQPKQMAQKDSILEAV